MNQQNAHLLRLIQLHEGHLSDAEGVSVREQLATDPVLLRRWKELSSIYDKEISLSKTEDPEGVGPELVAAFIEQRMSSSEQEEFESACWENAEAIREIISAVQASHADSTAGKLPKEFNQHFEQASRRMQSIAQQQCGSTDHSKESLNYFQKIEEHQQSELPPTANDFTEPEIEGKPLERLPITRRQASKRKTVSRRQKQQQQRWVIGTVLVAVVAIAFPVYLALNNKQASIEIPVAKTLPLGKQHPSQKSTEATTNNNLVKTQQPEDKKSPTQKLPIDNSSPAPDSMIKQGDGKSVIVKQENKTKKSPEKQEMQIVWTQVSGIAGYRNENSLPWKGILSVNNEKKTGSNNVSLIFRTLPSSWMRGKVESGPEVVLDADSIVQLSIHGTSSQEQAEQSEKQTESIHTMIDLELHAGKIAISLMQAGDEVKVRNAEKEWIFQAKQDDTSIGIIQLENKTQQAVTFSGEVQVSQVALNKNVALKSSHAIVMTAKEVDKTSRVNLSQRWRSEPPQALKLSDTFIAEINQSDNLLAALYSPPADISARELHASTRLGFSLDPVATVPRAASSKIETQRTAAIEWLLASAGNKTTDAVWNIIAVKNNQSSLSVRAWFEAAQRKVTPNQKLLAELSTGLNPNQPLFIRQCSIHFLRQITRQPLAEYNPDKPSKAAISSVRVKVRRATGSKTRRRR